MDKTWLVVTTPNGTFWLEHDLPGEWTARLETLPENIVPPGRYEPALTRRQALDRDAVLEEAERLRTLINTPEIEDFLQGVRLESAHQIERWGTAHDRDKSAENWYWLVGYLGGKALRSSITGDRDKALHHCISSAAALMNWHRAIRADTSGAGIGKDGDIAPDGSEIKPIDAALKREPSAAQGPAHDLPCWPVDKPDVAEMVERLEQYAAYDWAARWGHDHFFHEAAALLARLGQERPAIHIDTKRVENVTVSGAYISPPSPGASDE